MAALFLSVGARRRRAAARRAAQTLRPRYIDTIRPHPPSRTSPRGGAEGGETSEGEDNNMADAQRFDVGYLETSVGKPQKENEGGKDSIVESS